MLFTQFGFILLICVWSKISFSGLKLYQVMVPSSGLFQLPKTRSTNMLCHNRHGKQTLMHDVQVNNEVIISYFYLQCSCLHIELWLWIWTLCFTVWGFKKPPTNSLLMCKFLLNMVVNLIMQFTQQKESVLSCREYEVVICLLTT